MSNRISAAEVEALLKQLMVDEHPILQGALTVKIDLKSKYRFEARTKGAMQITLTFGILPVHKDFPKAFDHALTAVLRMRRGETWAVATREHLTTAGWR